MLKDNIRTKEELEKIADLMLAEATKHQGEEAVLRYHETQYDTKKFDDDKVSSGQSTDASFNKELMTRGQYSVTPLRVRLGLYPEMTVARDLVTHRFNFKRKEIPLPSDKTVKLESIPDNFDKYDSEFREFSKNNEGTNLARMMEVDTQIIVNSNGGVSIQQIPTLSIRFNYGLPPVVTSRTISVVCRNDEDMGRLPKLIKYLADPTPDRRVANSRNFSDAFTELVKISRL